jgi:hypothetical protein
VKPPTLPCNERNSQTGIHVSNAPETAQTGAVALVQARALTTGSRVRTPLGDLRALSVTMTTQGMVKVLYEFAPRSFLCGYKPGELVGVIQE